MKAFIKRIDLNPVENTSLGDIEIQFLYTYREVEYILVNGHNKIEGSIKLPNSMDSIQEIITYIETECREMFKEGGAK